MVDQALLQEEQDEQQHEQGTAEQPAAPTGPVDADDRALADAEADLAAEEEAKKAAEAAGTQPGATEDEPQPEPDPAAATTARQPVTVPIERLNQETTKTRTAQEEAAYWRGKAEALETVHKAAAPSAGGAPPEQPKTPAERIKDLRTKEIADAEAYNAGDIDVVELTRRRAEIDDQIADIRSNAAISVATERATAPQTSEWLAAETARIEQEFPVTAHVSIEELQHLSEIAKAEMKREGKPFDGRSRESILELRQRTAELADHNFSHRIPASTAKPANGAKSTTSTPTPPAPTAAQRAAKARLAERAPPDLTRAGSAATASGIDEKRLEQMSPKELDGLTDAELEALERKYL